MHKSYVPIVTIEIDDSIDQENRFFPRDKYTNDDKESGNPIVSSQLIAERLDAIILKMKKMLER